jgi:zinc protease
MKGERKVMIGKLCSLVLVGVLLACQPSETAPREPGPMAADSALEASDLTADELIARAMTARGGEEKLRGLHSVKLTGTLTTREAGSSPTLVVIEPGRYLRRIEQGAGGSMIHAVDGQATWEVNPRNGITEPKTMSAKDAARFRRFADPQGPLVNHQGKGNQVKVLGRMSWNGAQVYKLEVTFPDGGIHYLYLDGTSFLPVRMVHKLYVAPLDKDIDVEFSYSDFREVDGVKWPFKEEGDAPEVNFRQSISWDKIETNLPSDSSLFQMPKS